MTVRVYRSSDASAPVMTGNAGSLCAVLYACLVTGYGALTAAGWAREFTTTNKAVFRPATGNRCRLRVDDTSTQEARITGYEVMTTDTDTGTGQFPTSGQVPGGLFFKRSSTSDATARPWVLVASATAFYLFSDHTGTDWLIPPSGANVVNFFFGDLQSFKSGDAYGTAIISSETTGGSNCRLGTMTSPVAANANSIGHYMARAFYQVGASVGFCKWGPMHRDIPTVMGVDGHAFPDPITGAMLVSPVYAVETGPGNYGFARGILPGLYSPCHTNPGNHGDLITGSGESVGKTFLLFNTAQGGSLGRGALDISDSW